MEQELKNRISKLEQEIQNLKSFTTISFEIDGAFRERFRLSKIAKIIDNAPMTAITAPSGGATQDGQARTAINSIITALETLGLLREN